MFSSFACIQNCEVPLRSCEVTQPESQPCGQGSQTPNHHCWGQRRKQLTDLLTYYLARAFGCIWLDMIGLVVKLFRDAPNPSSCFLNSIDRSRLPRTRCSLWPLPGRENYASHRYNRVRKGEQVPQNISVNQNDCFVRTT